MSLFSFFKPKNKVEAILNKYYKNFDRKPYISPNRNFDQWEEMVAMSPKMLVQRDTMIPYEDGLLPGHVYMLYWIENVHRSQVPEYFEYEYGIDFAAEKKYLKKLDLLSDNEIVTDKGRQAIQTHFEVITKRNPRLRAQKTDSTINTLDFSRSIPPKENDSVEEIPREEYNQLRKEVDFLNFINEDLSKKYNLPQMIINFNLLRFGKDFFETHYIYTPFTKTKRASKYPLATRYSYYNNLYGTPAAFGEIYYLQNGVIGKVREVFWIKEHEGYVISLGQTKGKLVLKYIEHLTPLDGEGKFIVKESK